MGNVPLTELGFIDIRKYVYDSLVNYVPLIQKIGTNNVHFWDINNSVAKKIRPFVTISQGGGSTNSLGIREQGYSIDIFTTSIEECEAIRDIIIDLLNRRDLDGIKSRLVRLMPERGNSEKGIFRQILDFEFIFKDMKF